MEEKRRLEKYGKKQKRDKNQYQKRKNHKNAIHKYKGRPIQNSKNQRRLPVGFTHQLTFSLRPVISENLDTIHIIELEIRQETFLSFFKLK
jgi:CRISPR/Cas system-associated endoribonuclease Cas2